MKITLKNGHTLKSVSRWITIRTNPHVSSRNQLWYYATDENGNRPHFANFDKGTAELHYFRHANRVYALDEFFSRFSLSVGFDLECKTYPDFVCGYHGESYFNPLLCEIDASGEKIRLWAEI